LVTEIDYNPTYDDVSGSGDSQALRIPQQSNASTQAEGVTPSKSTLTAGISRSGRVCTMSRRMANSKLQCNFYRSAGMHYMANVSEAYLNETPEDLLHDQHLDLQERMRNPIAFHAEVMGDIMYYHQALHQPDAHQFAKAVVKEVNGHLENNHWQFIKHKDVPEGAQVVPSVWSPH